MRNEDNLTDWASFSFEFEFEFRNESASRSCVLVYSVIAGNDIERDINIIISGSKSFTLIASLHSYSKIVFHGMNPRLDGMRDEYLDMQMNINLESVMV